METLDHERDFILDPSLVLYLPLWKKDGAQFMSDDRYGHLCTVNGAVWTPQGRVFDGDDKIVVPKCDAINISGAFSVVWWMKITAGFTGSWRHALWKRYTDGDGIQGWHVCLHDASNVISLTRWVDSTGKSTPVVSFTVDTWDLWAAIYDGTYSRLYRNLILLSTGPEDGRTLKTDTDFQINHSLEAIEDDVFHFNRAISPLEMANIYEATKWRHS